MAFALHFRSHPWHPISTAPCNRGVELRVRDGRAISTLEFPCQQTNAGDWINCDFGTPINIQPLEWRAWQHGHSPQPQSPQVNTRGRSALTRRDHRTAKRLPPVEVKPLDRSVRRPKILTTMAYALVGIVVVATAVGSLTRISAWALPIGLTRAPASSVAVSSIAAVSPSPTEDSCKEFGAAFLNAACATPHKRFAGRRSHRVATYVVGRSDAQQ